MSDKKVGRSPQIQDPERAAGSEVGHPPHDQAELAEVPEAMHGDKAALLARFREREEKQRSLVEAQQDAVPADPDGSGGR
jgi:hypothetical protein